MLGVSEVVNNLATLQSPRVHAKIFHIPDDHRKMISQKDDFERRQVSLLM